MIEDWRITNQEKYLTGVTLYKSKYSLESDNFNHDHCEFCWAKFADKNYIPDAQDQGYTTEDRYRWICEGCFHDFKEFFSWKVIIK